MPSLPPDKKFLEYLSQFGIGNYKKIDEVLIELFPMKHPASEKKINDHVLTIEHFLADMVSNQFIKLKIIGGDNSAAIQPKGVEYLEKRSISRIQTHVVGDYAQVVVQSPSASLKSERIVDISPITPTTTNTIPKRPKIRSWVEMTVWIISIITGLILIQQYFFPHIFDKAKEQHSEFSLTSDQATEMERRDKAYSNFTFPRHVTNEDIKRIIAEVPSDNDTIVFMFTSGDREVENFEKELYKSMTRYYKNFLQLPPYGMPIGLKQKFLVGKSIFFKNHLDVTIYPKAFYGF